MPSLARPTERVTVKSLHQKGKTLLDRSASPDDASTNRRSGDGRDQAMGVMTLPVLKNASIFCISMFSISMRVSFVALPMCGNTTT